MRHFPLCLTASLSLVAVHSLIGCSGTSPGDGTGGATAAGAAANAGTGGTRTDGSGSAAGSGATGSGSTSGGGGSGSGTGAGGTSAGGTGGTDGVPPSDCTDANLEACANGIGTHCGYTYEYWKDSGTGCLENTTDGFSVEWSGINNLLGRKGIRPGTAANVVTYEADYNPNGNSYLCVYGWTKTPLVEYYIVDSWGSWRPPGGEGFMGTVTSDGGTYDIYRTQRVQQPSIEGTQTFYQFWSVRQEKRESGTITVGNHFAAWEDLGMDMGALYEVSMTVEGYQSSGDATVKMHIE